MNKFKAYVLAVILSFLGLVGSAPSWAFTYQETAEDLYESNYAQGLAWYYGHYGTRYNDATYRYYSYYYTDYASNWAYEGYYDGPSGSYAELYSYYAFYYLYYASLYRYYTYLGYDYSNDAALYAYYGQYYTSLASVYAAYQI